MRVKNNVIIIISERKESYRKKAIILIWLCTDDPIIREHRKEGCK